MFRKNKKVIEKSETYREIEKLYKELVKYEILLTNAARKYYTRHMAMICYIPMNQDWNIQGDRCREAQIELSTYMAHYDKIYRDINELIKKEPSNWAKPLESHEVVEIELARTLR